MRTRCATPLLIGTLWLVGGGSVQADEEPDATDWPAVISRLQQEVYQRPGHALTRQQLAIAYNNYGVSLGQQGQWTVAIEQLREALRLDEKNGQFRVNLSNIFYNKAQSAFQQRQVQEALEALEEAVTVNPKFPEAYTLLGEIEYGRQRLKEAKAAWEQAVALDAGQAEAAKRLAQVTQELPVESKFERVSQAYFDIRYEGELERPAGFDVREALLDARRRVGADFANWPKYRLVVLLYSAESFRVLRQETPDWVAGQFDGKIRVPLPNGRLDPKSVTQIVFHEYTHAIVQDLANGKCPTWLNEGLAEYEGRREGPSVLVQLVAAYGRERLIPWEQLSDQFSTKLPVDEVALGYQESYSIARYLATRYGFWRIRRLLKTIADGRPWQSALSEEFRVKLTRLEAQWREWLPELFAQDQGAPR